MFTGIIEKVASVQSITKTSDTSFTFKISNPYSAVSNDEAGRIEMGESISNNGACLTVTAFDANFLQFDVSPETVLRTALARLKPGRKVNLERSLRMGDRMSGHWVQGHVDGTAKVVTLNEVEKGYYDLEIEPTDPKLMRYCVKKGSLSVDGISLTIHDLSTKSLKFQIIPHTWSETALSDLSHGDLVNIEVDILAKYIERFHSYDQETASGH
jgi:riboflavin synthase